MGGGLRKPYAVAGAKTDAELDWEDEQEAKREQEQAAKQKAAVAHVVDNLFPYAPVTVQTQKYPSSSPKAGQAYLWITVDEDALKRRGTSVAASPVRYPVGVAVDAEGNVFVSEAASASDGSGADHHTRATHRISASSIMELATTNQPPALLKPPLLLQATQTSLKIRWKKAVDTTVDRYEVQYRCADSVNNAWAGLVSVSTAQDVSLEHIRCHTPYEFRVRAHNPAGWNEFSSVSAVFWSLPGPPATPVAPIAGAVSNVYASIFWSRVDDHGSSPVLYFLDARESTSASFRQIYEGTECGFVASGLTPKATYIFRLQASNAVGSTPFVESRPVRTLAHGRPEIVELTSVEESATYDRWVQCWDPKTEQIFYFNRYTCQRVVDEPSEVAAARQRVGVDNVEETPEMVFRRKRFRFHRDLRQRLQGASLAAILPLELRRESMFDDTFAHFQRLSKQELMRKPKVAFENEAGIDSGGLTKDWFLQISRLAVDKQRHLFTTCNQSLVEINTSSFRNTRHLQEFKFIGKLMAKTIFDRQTMDLPLCDSILKHLLEIPPTMDDLKQMDAQFHKSLVWMLDNEIAGVIDETFSVEVECAGSGIKQSTTVMDLKENGRDIPVTDLNKSEYVELMVQWRTEFGVKAQLDALAQGFAFLIPLSSIKQFELSELKMLVNGKPTIDVEELRACTVFQGGYSEHSQVILWLWQALREFSLELRGTFLKFMTGTNKIPLDGFEPPLNLTKSDLDPQALPRTHTCFNQLVLPEYQSYEALVDKITFAIKNAEGFELS